MRARFRALGLFFGLGIFIVLAVGCNDTLRQFITPVPGPTGNPGVLAHAIVLSTNPATVANTPQPSSLPGSDMHIDVSGDSAVGVVPVGPNPVFLGTTSNRAFVVNSGDPNTPPTVSVYTALLPGTATVSTVTLPNTSLAPIAGATSSANNIYIANSGSNNVDVIDGNVLAQVKSIPVGTKPVMIAGNTANNKIFVINQGSNDVTEISAIDNTVIKTIPVGNAPVWGVMSTDGLFVFVVNQGDGTVSVIDASLDLVLPCAAGPACPNPASGAIKVGTTASPSPNFAFYEPRLKRVYVNNTGENSISVIKGNGFDLGVSPQVLPAKIADVPLSGPPVSVTATPDGTKAYVALGNCPAGINHLNIIANLPNCTGNQVGVIDATALSQIRTITVGAGAVSVSASSDSSRVYAISANDITIISDNVHPAGSTLPNRQFTTPSVYVIPTDTNVPLATPVDPSVVSSPLPTFHTPQQDPNCVSAIDPNFNSKVPLPCPLQQPFVVRTFP